MKKHCNTKIRYIEIYAPPAMRGAIPFRWRLVLRKPCSAASVQFIFKNLMFEGIQEKIEDIKYTDHLESSQLLYCTDPNFQYYNLTFKVNYDLRVRGYSFLIKFGPF